MRSKLEQGWKDREGKLFHVLIEEVSIFHEETRVSFQIMETGEIFTKIFSQEDLEDLNQE